VKPAFLKRLAKLVDLKAIAKSGIKVVYDPFWGAGRGYSCHLLREAGVAVETVHDYRDVLFGGHAPEPDDHLLGDCKAKMKEIGAALGIATDGDADRFGIVDADGTFIQPNYVIALLFDYLVETRGWKNGVAKSVATTNLINALADYHKVPLYETPVGFKYIGELIIADKIAIGGEESAGLTIRGHVPEKDGVIAGLLVAEMVATRGKSLGEQLKELFAKVGSYYPVRENFHLTPEVKAAFTEKMKADPTELGGRKVSAGGAHRRAEADSRRRLVGLLPAVGDRAGGAGLHRSAQRTGHGSIEGGGGKVCESTWARTEPTQTGPRSRL
jgi:phosphoglucomutase